MDEITVVGFGSCGIFQVEKIEEYLESKKRIEDFRLRLIKCDADKDRLNVNFLKDCVQDKMNAISQSIYIENEITRGLGTGCNSEYGNAIYQKQNTKKMIESLLDSGKKILVCGGLGGGFGSQFLSNFAVEHKEKVIAFAVYPAEYESQKRHDNADKALKNLEVGNANYKVFNIQDVIQEHIEDRLTTREVHGLTAEVVVKEIMHYLEEEKKRNGSSNFFCES